MKHRLILGLLLTAVYSTSYAADMENGKQLHLANCVSCHDSAIYTRENRRVTSMPKLGQQVRMCRDMLGITWFDDEVDDVILYLNTNYYHF